MAGRIATITHALLLAGLSAIWVLSAAAGQAQSLRITPAPPFLMLEQERVLTGSLFGRDLLALNEQETQALREEGQRLDREFEAEEQALTEQRGSLSPEAFRVLADAFDEKVVATRAAQEEKAAALSARLELRQRNFFARVGPILLTLLEETGASAIVEQRTVLVAKQDLNITNEVIRRLDAAYREQAGDGGSPTPDPD